MAMYNRVCRTCGSNFGGGPRAWYCPVCRAERYKISKDRYNRDYRNGTVRRPLGSTDKCLVCGNDYIVSGSKQKYCPNCARPAVMSIDRVRGLEYYRRNSASINPSRNIKRRNPPEGVTCVCAICGKQYQSRTARSSLCGSDACRKARQRQYDARRPKLNN